MSGRMRRKGDTVVPPRLERRKNRWANQEVRQARKKEPIDPAVREKDAKKLVCFLIGHPCKHRGQQSDVREIDCPQCLKAAILAFAAKWADGRGIADVFRLNTAEQMAEYAMKAETKAGKDYLLDQLVKFLSPDPEFVNEVKKTIKDSEPALKASETCQLHGLEFSPHSLSDGEMCLMGCTRGIPS